MGPPNHDHHHHGHRPSVEVAPGVGFRLTETRIGAGAGASFPPLNISDPDVARGRRPELEMWEKPGCFVVLAIYAFCCGLLGLICFCWGSQAKEVMDSEMHLLDEMYICYNYICPTKSQRGSHFMVKLGRCFKRDFLRTTALVVFDSANLLPLTMTYSWGTVLTWEPKRCGLRNAKL